MLIIRQCNFNLANKNYENYAPSMIMVYMHDGF